MHRTQLNGVPARVCPRDVQGELRASWRHGEELSTFKGLHQVSEGGHVALG